MPGCLLLPLSGHCAKSAFEGGFYFYPGSSCQVTQQTSWCFCKRAMSGNFELFFLIFWGAEADQMPVGCSIGTVFPVGGHSITAWPYHRSNSCWQHCEYSAHKPHLYNKCTTRSQLSRNLGAAEETLHHTHGHLCTQNLLGRNMTALSMHLLPSTERLGWPC